LANTNAISVQDLCVSFNENQVLQNVSFDVREGEIFGLVGLNGIGKTTLIKTMLNLILPDSGAIDFFGISHGDLEAKKQYCYLPEKFTPSIFLKGREFLEFAIRFHRNDFDSSKAAQVCEALDLAVEFLDKKVKNYSKGMGQKLGLASIFLSEPKVAILDEPMSGLDPSARIALKQQLKLFKKSGKTVFFSSHILSDIEEICDRICILNKGKIVYIGSVQDLLASEKESLESAFLRIIKT
jgi:ABC-2 type transport system ATP-binding protein